MHAMIDIESLSTAQDAAILQIAVVQFEPVFAGKVLVDDAFNIGVKLDGQLGAHVDGNTLGWWLMQGQRARKNIADMQTNGKPLAEALQLLGSWWRTRRPQMVWAHGVVFDIGCLSHAYARVGQEAPWSYREVLDTRTLYWHTTHERRSYAATPHDALSDVIAQAEEVQQALRRR